MTYFVIQTWAKLCPCPMLDLIMSEMLPSEAAWDLAFREVWASHSWREMRGPVVLERQENEPLDICARK